MSWPAERTGGTATTAAQDDDLRRQAPLRLLLTASHLVAGGAIVIGHNEWAGPPVLVLTASRGVTVGDLGIVLLVLIAMALTWQAASRGSSPKR